MKLTTVVHHKQYKCRTKETNCDRLVGSDIRKSPDANHQPHHIYKHPTTIYTNIESTSYNLSYQLLHEGLMV